MTGILKLDLVNNKIYWVDTILDKIRRANLNGSGVEDVATVANLAAGLALDVANNRMYYCTNTHIVRANLDGSGSQNIITFAGVGPSGINIDYVSGKIYWFYLPI